MEAEKMTLHPSAAAPAAPDPARALGEAVQMALASSHARRLDTAVQSALNGFADAFAALVVYASIRNAELADALKRIAALEARETTRIPSDP
jgi:hypothetical protein